MIINFQPDEIQVVDTPFWDYNTAIPNVLATPGQGQGGPAREIENVRGTPSNVLTIGGSIGQP